MSSCSFQSFIRDLEFTVHFEGDRCVRSRIHLDEVLGGVTSYEVRMLDGGETLSCDEYRLDDCEDPEDEIFLTMVEEDRWGDDFSAVEWSFHYYYGFEMMFVKDVNLYVDCNTSEARFFVEGITKADYKRLQFPMRTGYGYIFKTLGEMKMQLDREMREEAKSKIEDIRGYNNLRDELEEVQSRVKEYEVLSNMRDKLSGDPDFGRHHMEFFKCIDVELSSMMDEIVDAVNELELE